MIRTVWLAAACLVVLGAMAAGKVAKTPAAQTTDEMPIATVGTDLNQEPLIKADRLEITYVPRETPGPSASQSIDSFVPDVPTAISPAETNIVSRHWHDPNAAASSTATSKRTAKKGKSAADSRDSHGSFQARRAD
jgi:hypothetical protein